MSATLATRLHDEGWEYGKRRFKMFTFSQLFSRAGHSLVESVPVEARITPIRHLRFTSPCWFFVSSPENQILQELAQSLLSDREGRLGNNMLQLLAVAVLPPSELPAGGFTECDVETMSPITVYKTDETKHTTYFSPHDAAFEPYIRENARRKYAAYMGNEPDLRDFSIRPLEERDHGVTINFKGTMIRGYTGRFHVTGQSDVLRFLYDTGVGSKNPEGCGMVSLMDGYRRQGEEGENA